MNNSSIENIENFDFKNLESFGIKVVDNNVVYYGKKLLDIVEKYGSPIKIYNPEIITNRIEQAQKYFKKAILDNNYNGNYTYCYCTKSNHFSFVIKQILGNNKEKLNNESVHLETSSSFDADIISHLDINPETFIIHNGFKAQDYIKSIKKLSKKYINSICVLDNLDELDDLNEVIDENYKIGIRMATKEKGKDTEISRLGVPMDDIIPFIKDKLEKYSNFELKMVHFFMNFGIKDDNEYYEGLRNHVEKYCEIKKICPSLEMLNIGGGLPIRFGFEENHDYEKIIYNIVKNIKEVCDKNNVSHPNIFSEFGSYSVGESAINIYQVLREKVQKSGENWYMIDSSFMTTIPDSWGLHQTFPVLPLNNLGDETKNVMLGGITCDKDDYLTNKNGNYFNMPVLKDNNNLYFMVMHTGAYQENISGYGIGGLSHCQLDGEKILILKENGEVEIFFDGNDTKERLKTLGYE